MGKRITKRAILNNPEQVRGWLVDIKDEKILALAEAFLELAREYSEAPDDRAY